MCPSLPIFTLMATFTKTNMSLKGPHSALAHLAAKYHCCFTEIITASVCVILGSVNVYFYYLEIDLSFCHLSYKHQGA